MHERIFHFYKDIESLLGIPHAEICRCIIRYRAVIGYRPRNGKSFRNAVQIVARAVYLRPAVQFMNAAQQIRILLVRFPVRGDRILRDDVTVRQYLRTVAELLSD